MQPASYEESNMSLQGKTALVTGSTSGIGLGIALTLAKAGANLVLNGFGDASAVIEQVKQYGG
jgi:3-hydroxybutyrate dehydrogenase